MSRAQPAVLAEVARPVLSALGPVVIGAGILHGQAHVRTFVLCVLGITLLDRLLPAAPGVADRPELSAARIARLLPHLHLPVQLLMLAAATQLWCEPDLALHERFGMALGFGVYACAFGINVAHELIHRRSRVSRVWGGLQLALVCYGSFKIEHVRGHHLHVATPLDASTAPRGRSFWAHLPKAVAGNLTTAWRLDARETGAWAGVSGVLGLGILALWGLDGLVFFGLQSATAICALELTNYVEHYGLERGRLPSGRLEPVGPAHSWSSPVRFSNALFFNVQRHAHHHARPGLGYERLRHLPGSPTHRLGYPAMMGLALVPPLWRRVVEPELQRWARAGVDRGAHQRGVRCLSAASPLPR